MLTSAGTWTLQKAVGEWRLQVPDGIEPAVQGPIGAEASITTESRVGLGANDAFRALRGGWPNSAWTIGFQMAISFTSKIVEEVFEWVVRGQRVGQGAVFGQRSVVS